MFEEKLLEPHFTSVLAPYMLDVVEQKRALGNKYNAGVEALSAFDDFCNEQQLRIPAISKELLQKWEKKRPHENETTQCFRISYVRILCKYLHSNGYDAPCAFHPAPHVNKCFVPYIFTKDEIERLFSAVDCTKESSESPLRHLVMPVLFRLLYTCGLRVSEALHLKVADVDLDAGVLAIYGAKGDKERLVGISDSMLTYMKSYRSNPLVANAQIENMLTGHPCTVSEAVRDIVNQQGRKYTEHLLSATMEAGFDLHAIPAVLLGGGASVVSRHLSPKDGLCKTIFLLDDKVNAVGFERALTAVSRRKSEA